MCVCRCSWVSWLPIRRIHGRMSLPSNNNVWLYGRTGGATRQVLWDWQWQHLWPATPEKTCVVSLQSLHTIQPCTNTTTHTQA